MCDFNKILKPVVDNFPVIDQLPTEKITMALNYIRKAKDQKESENHYKSDNGQLYKRLWTGITGELAIESLIGKDFVDFTVGDSNIYNKADLSSLGINCGVKTIEWGKFPLVMKNEKTPQIIVVKSPDPKMLRFLVLGVATPDVLQEFSSDELILSDSLRRRGTKTAFYGLRETKPFKNYEELVKILETNG